MTNHTRLLPLLTIVIATFAAKVDGATVTYAGTAKLHGLPVVGGFTIAGAFKPGFDPHSYKYVYGDQFGNMLQSNYSQAVADGNFIPFGSGVLTMANGAVVGSGATNLPAGQRIWLFMFDHPSPDLAIHFALGSGPLPEWSTAPVHATVHHTSANEFVFGSKPLGGIWELQGFPIPEPTTLGLATFALSFARFRRSRFAA